MKVEKSKQKSITIIMAVRKKNITNTIKTYCKNKLVVNMGNY